MLGVKFAGNEKVELVERPIPEVKEGEVLIKVKASGLCGSELGGYRSSQGLDEPIGHEFTGEVADANKAKRLKLGDRVGIHIFQGCGNCKYCRSGNQAFCEEIYIIVGGHGEYVAVPEQYCLLLPDDISYEAGVLLTGDTIGVAYHLLNRMRVSALDTVGIIGAGPIGLGMTLVLKLLGARLIVLDTVDYRLDLVKKLGAEVQINPNQGDVLAKVKDITKGNGVDIALECVGSEPTLNTALTMVKKGGLVGVVGENSRATINPSDTLIHKKLTLMGSWYYNIADYEGMLSLYYRGLKVEDIITHRFSLKDADKAFKIFSSKQSGKVMINP